MTTKNRIRPWMLVSAIWVWPALFNVLQRVLRVRLQGWDPPTARELLFTAGDWLIYAAVTPVIFWISRRWPVARPHIGRRLAIHSSWALAFCVVWATGGKLLDLGLMSILTPDKVHAAILAAGDHLAQKIATDVASWILTTLPFGMVVYTTVAGMAHAIEYFSEARERDVQNVRLSEQLSTARFSALQAQLNPHFLFNTLNTIAVLVRDGDRSGAGHIVEQLSNVLRRTLSRHRANEVALDEELDLVRQYLAIEQARFSDRLRVVIEVPDALLTAAIPGFAVQHLVENAIRHGIAKRTAAAQVTVSARRDGEILELFVSDDGPGIDVDAVVPSGHGLDNTRERLRAMFGERASLTLAQAVEGGTVAILRIPYRDFVREAENVAR